MVLLIHIIVALSSLAVSTASYVRPAKQLLQTSYALIGLTLASGTYLVLSTSAHLLQSCVTGLVYVGAVSVIVVGARRKLAAETTRSR